MKVKATIIGAGVVGLAIAKILSDHIKDDSGVVVVEKEKSFGQGISSRNSEVIHAGIYYLTGSLKHTLCIEGRRMLYKYCEGKNIPHKKCGKLIIATSENEKESLENVFSQAKKNAVENVIRLSGKEALALEPGINAHEALLSKETGIIDTHSLMAALEKETTSNNGTVVYSSEVISIKYANSIYEVKLNDGTVFETEYLINSAGLTAFDIAKLLNIKTETLYPCKGSYFSYSGPIKFSHLIYPVPEKKLTGLGVHATIDLGGRLKFGPDTEYINNTTDYNVDKNKKGSFFSSANKLIKNIKPEDLVPDMAGIRPKIQGPDDKQVKDFYIKEEKDFPKFINLLGIESPGLTSCLAIGKHIYSSFFK